VARLAKINAPELHDVPAGKESQQALAGQLVVSKLYRVWMSGREKYGRTMMEFYNDKGVSVNQWMIDNGFAKKWDGKGERP
jgi:endonuclease YncB( thermonuclease family)